MKQKYLTCEKFNDIVSKLEDYRDKLLLTLVWEGHFKEGYKSLVDVKGIVTDNENLKSLIKLASKERSVTVYSLANVTNSWKEDLIESDYLLRQTQKFCDRKDIEVGKSFNGYSMNRVAIINRMTMLKAKFKDELDGESLQTIYFAGLLDRVIKNINTSLPENVQRTMAMDYLTNVERLKRGRSYGYWNIIRDELVARGLLGITTNSFMEV